MADPEQYRTKEEVAEWRGRDPIPAFAERLIAEGVTDEAERDQLDAEALARVDAAVEFADASPFPAPDSLFDDVYVLDPQKHGWYSVETTPERQESPAGDLVSDTSEIPQQLTHALAAGEDSSEHAGGEGGTSADG
jgi:hypothetical protein